MGRANLGEAAVVLQPASITLQDFEKRPSSRRDVGAGTVQGV